jgi:hypothetical protein
MQSNYIKFLPYYRDNVAMFDRQTRTVVKNSDFVR